MKRYNNYKVKWLANFSLFLNEIWTHIYGIITVISFIVAIILAILTIKKTDGPNFTEILYILTALIFVLSIIIIRISLKYSNLHSISSDLLKMENENDNLHILLRQQSETFHNVSHYYRNLISQLDSFKQKFTENENDITEKDYQEIANRNEYFLIQLTTSLQNYFSIYTDDNCAITLKILNADKLNVQTVYRDPVNLKKRRQAESSYINDGTYSIFDNTAFEIIVDENYTNIYFASDNLKELFESHNYKNSNPHWYNLYNSTIVVAVSMPIEKSERKVVGFLTVDNLKGNLADENCLEFLYAISDLLYHYFVRIIEFTKLAHSKGIYNEKYDRFTFGSNC